MALTKTPICEFNKPASDFRLLGVDNRYYTLADCTMKNGVLIMFICNHCPYVQAILDRLIIDAQKLKNLSIGVVAICSNASTDYPEDSFKNMQKLAKEKNFPFPYLVDETQEVAKAYKAVCTPDFFGYNSNLKLQYRGRLGDGELVDAMRRIATTGKGPQDQKFSQGCSIKWK